MAKKKVVYYKILTLDNNTGKEIDFKRLKNLFLDIVETKSVDGILSLDRPNDKASMDKFYHSNEIFFARLGKETASNSMAFRNNDRKVDPLLGEGDQSKWVDKLTYFLINFDLGILLIANNQSALKAKDLSRVFEKYNNNYSLVFEPIPNENYYKALFNEGSSLSKITYKIPVPNVEALQRIPGISTRQFNALREMDSNTIEIVISNGPRKLLSNNKNVIEEFVDDSAERVGEYDGFKIIGKPSDEQTHTFDLKDEFFSHTVDIRTHRMQNREKFELGLNALYDEYKVSLIAENRSQRNMIGGIINRV